MNSPRVCIIDDQPSFVRLCEQILTGEGYLCESVLSLTSAVEEVAATKPDVVILDIRLGSEVDGLQVLTCLSREGSSTRAIPIVICTASRDLLATHHDLIEELGCEVVEKPFELETLISAVQRCLESSRAAA